MSLNNKTYLAGANHALEQVNAWERIFRLMSVKQHARIVAQADEDKFTMGLDGNMWYILCGTDLQVGIAGFGINVDEAFNDLLANVKKAETANG